MNKKITVLFIGVIFLVARFHAQQVTEDSLAGFDPTTLPHYDDHGHDPGEIAMALKIAQRNYIDKKYSLGKYAPDYQYPGMVYPNPPMPVAACTNVDFENGDFSGWLGAIGDNDNSGTGNQGPLSNISPGFFTTGNDAPVSDAAARHTIITPAFGNDPYGGFPGVPPGAGNYTIRMGGQTPLYQGETIEQTFTVDPLSTSFAYRYAVVLNDPPSGHGLIEKPYFKIEVLNVNGLPISTCTQYFVISDPNIPGFYASPQNAPNGDPVFYRPWTTVNFDLTGFVGQNITVRFTVAGCTLSGHFGYAYIDCSCVALAAAVNFCPGNTTVMLTGPDGYAGYQWQDPNGNWITGATNDTLMITNPNVGDTFHVYLTSIADTSCHHLLPVVLLYTTIYPNATATPETCYLYADGSVTATGSAGIAPYTYTWSPGNMTGQTITNVAPGAYVVHIEDAFGCEADDTTVVVAAPRRDTSAFNFDYCIGDPHMTLSVPPGYAGYVWIGPNGDTIPNDNPPHVQYLIGPQINDPYTVVILDPPNCPLYDTLVLDFTPPDYYFMPDTMVNVFTPNNDQKNDYFFPYYDVSVNRQTPSSSYPPFDFFELYIATFEIEVYDRWGTKVFFSSDYTIAWDGTYENKQVSDGVYYYITKYTTRCAEDMIPIIKTGFVHVVR